LLTGVEMNKEIGKARVLTPVEFKRVVKMQEGSKHSLRNISCLYISFYLMLRAKEISNLTISTFVDKTGALKKEVLLKRSMTKGKKQRRVYLTNEKLRKVLMDYLELRKKNDTYNLEAPLILSQKQGSFTPDTMQKLFSRMFQSVGLDGARSHSGRRTGATRLIEDGVGIRNIQVLLGHSNISSTIIYLQENPALLGKISNKLSI
jgi:integrase/recombinase XerD